MIKKLLFILLVFSTSHLMAQDIHFTQFQMAPMNFNPAQTGAFNGTVRVGGIYRDQWSIYKTPSVFIDAPILNIRKKDWLGIGFSAIKDEAGDAGLNYTGAKLAVAYHLAFDKKRTTVLSIGAQYGMMGRNVNRDKLTFEDELKTPGGGGISEDYAKIKDAKFKEIDAGINLRSAFSKTANMNIGIGVNHLNSPKNGQIELGYKLPMRLIAHGQVNVDYGKKWILSPAFLYQSISSSSELELQAVGTYKFSPDWKFRGGAGYRLGDAAEILLGAHYKDLNVGFAYDIGVSGRNSALKNIGAFEIAANYIFKIFKKPKVDPIIFCPRF